jgi:hypothetical protein
LIYDEASRRQIKIEFGNNNMNPEDEIYDIKDEPENLEELKMQ